MKKTKKFLGDIPFDYFGNYMDQDRGYGKHMLTKDNFQNGVLYLNSYDHAQKKWVMMPVINPPIDFEVTYLDHPLQYYPNVIATIPYCLYVPNFEFDDKIQYVSSKKSRYSVVFSFKSLITNKEYSMFSSGFDKAVPLMEKGILEGRFTFCKRGSSFALKLV